MTGMPRLDLEVNLKQHRSRAKSVSDRLAATGGDSPELEAELTLVLDDIVKEVAANRKQIFLGNKTEAVIGNITLTLEEGFTLDEEDCATLPRSLVKLYKQLVECANSHAPFPVTSLNAIHQHIDRVPQIAHSKIVGIDLNDGRGPFERHLPLD